MRILSLKTLNIRQLYVSRYGKVIPCVLYNGEIYWYLGGTRSKVGFLCNENSKVMRGTAHPFPAYHTVWEIGAILEISQEPFVMSNANCGNPGKCSITRFKQWIEGQTLKYK